MGIFGGIGNAVKGAAQTAVGVSPYVAQALAQKKAQDDADAQRKLQALHLQNQDRVAQQNADTAAGSAKARSAALETGTWSNPFAGTDEQGNPVLVQQHKQTGELRLATLGPVGGADPIRTPAPAGPDAFAPKPWQIGNHAVQPATGTPLPLTPQAPTQPGTSAAPSGGLRPFVKPPKPVAQGHVVDPVTGEVKFFDPTKPPVGMKVNPKPVKDPQQSFTPFQGTDADGKPVVRPFNTKTGQFGAVADVAPKASANGQSGSQQAQQARLMAAVSEARLADERMRSFEDKLLTGGSSISPLKQAAGSLTSNLSDSHTPFGALTQAASEFGLNKSDPEYAQYLRDASTIGRAEQMMSPRGGNETMVRANALLSRAGTGAMKNTIDASRMARQALFGQSGGIAQTLTPEQNAKLTTGVQRIKAGEHGASVASPPSPAPQKATPATPKNDYGIFGKPDGAEE